MIKQILLISSIAFSVNCFALNKTQMLKIYSDDKKYQIEISEKRSSIINKIEEIKDKQLVISDLIQELKSLEIKSQQKQLNSIYSAFESDINKEKKNKNKNKSNKNKKESK